MWPRWRETGAAAAAGAAVRTDLVASTLFFVSEENFVEKGKQYTMFDFMDAEAKRAENAIHLKKVFSNFDTIIGPTLPVLPFNSNKNVPKGFMEEDLFSWLPFTYPFNLTKNPASTINVNFSKSGSRRQRKKSP